MALAAVIFQLAVKFSTISCHSIHLLIHGQGTRALLAIVLGVAVLTAFGLPIALSSIGAGILTNSVVGSALVGLGVTLGVTSIFLVSRLLSGNSKVLSLLDCPWTREFLESEVNSSTAPNSMVWTSNLLQKSWSPICLTAAFCGLYASKLSLQGFLAGTYFASWLVVFTFNLFGANVGCAVIDSNMGLNIDRYQWGSVVSIILVLITIKLRPRFIV